MLSACCTESMFPTFSYFGKEILVGSRAGSLVIVVDWCSSGRVFKSHHWTLDVYLFLLFDGNFLLFV